MLIRNFGITLTQLTIEDIELVRYWRNSKDISRFMEYRKFISAEQQKQWFESLDPLADFYFVINWNGQKVGLIHTSAINREERSAQAGLFVWHKDYLGTHIPVLASLAMLECFFGELGIEKYFAKVGRDNAVAIRYNAALGFRLHDQPKDSDFDQYVLDKDVYYSASEKLKKFASSVSHEAPEVVMEEGLREMMKR